MACKAVVTVKLLVFLLSFAFVVLVIIAPLVLPTRSVPRLDGIPGFIDNRQVFDTFAVPWNLVYLFGDFWCHQMYDRSFSLNGNQLPFCGRCFGIFLGIPLGCLASILWMFPVTPTLYRKVMVVLLVCLIPIGVDGGGQLMGLWESITFGRALTGILAGAGGGFIFGLLIDVLNFARQPTG